MKYVMDAKVKETLKTMIKGLTIYNVILLVVSLLSFIGYCALKKIATDEALIWILKNELGLLIGYIWSIISMYWLAKSLEKGISSGDQKYAKSHVGLMGVVRLAVFCILLVVIINEKTLGFAAGIMFALSSLGIKIGTYLVPILDSKKK